MVVGLLLTIGALLFFAKILGEISERIGVPSLVGEIIAGIVLGPILGFIVLDNFLQDLMVVEIIFLLFIAGLEIRAEDVKNNTYMASVLAVGGGMVSLILGFIVGIIFFNNILVALALGVVLMSTSNGTLFMILMKIGEFNTKIGRTIVSVTIADDVVGILALSLFTIYVSQSRFGLADAWYLFLLSLGFYLIVLTAGSKIANKLMNFFGIFRSQEVLLSMPVVIAFVLAYITDNLGLSLAVGAFLAGVAMANSKFTENTIRPHVETISFGLFIPLFYACIGTTLVFAGLDFMLVIALLVAAILGKFIGCGLLSRFFDHDWEEMKLIGLSMIPRGNENIVIVQIIFMLGVITIQAYTSVIFAMIMTLILAPILLKIFYRPDGTRSRM
jgi:Kef-type K+ transport system membrane component KefB